MFQYLLAFLLITSYYQSLGALQSNLLVSESLDALASQCENKFLAHAIKAKIKECAVSVPPYHKRQMQCLIFYDINRQLCSAVAEPNSMLTPEYGALAVVRKEEVTRVCQQAQNWIFSNITEYVDYKNASEYLFKSPAICGEMCGDDNIMNEANEFCKYYQWGTETLENGKRNAIQNSVDAPVIPEPDSNSKADIAVINTNQPQKGNTKTLNVQIKQTELAVNKTTAEETVESGAAITKSTAQATPKQIVNQDIPTTSDKKNNADTNMEDLEHSIDLPNVDTHEQANKSTVSNNSKTELENDPAVLPESGKDIPINMDAKEIVLEKAEGKPPSDPDDYADSEGNDAADEDADDQGFNNKSGADTKQGSYTKTGLKPSHNGDLSQKEYYPNPMTDTFTDDGDHFFPFFLTAVILVVLLYVLYHNKSKVSKVFFGLILEGRQSNRRRNSRGHSYRRLDTLEQAMSANTDAPPSKIIY